jgi:hypothetical protein
MNGFGCQIDEAVGLQKINNKRQMMACVLATTHHDPGGRMIDQITRMVPRLRQLFSGIAVQATDVTDAQGLAVLERAGASVRHMPVAGHVFLGKARRAAIAFGLEQDSDGMLFCDLDRMLHWAEYAPAELAQAVAHVQQHDFTVIGRTVRAFATHPQTQRDTESIVNLVFAQVSGHGWDVTAAARGLSKRAAMAIVAGCLEDSVGTDTAWPLFLEQIGGYSLGYLETEGMEFETPDRFGDQIAALGGLAAWMQRLDLDVREWALRLDVARAEVAAMQPYT